MRGRGIHVTGELLSAESFVSHVEHQLSGKFRPSLTSESLQLNQPASKKQTSLISFAKNNGVSRRIIFNISQLYSRNRRGPRKLTYMTPMVITPGWEKQRLNVTT